MEATFLPSAVAGANVSVNFRPVRSLSATTRTPCMRIIGHLLCGTCECHRSLRARLTCLPRLDYWARCSSESFSGPGIPIGYFLIGQENLGLSCARPGLPSERLRHCRKRMSSDSFFPELHLDLCGRSS